MPTFKPPELAKTPSNTTDVLAKRDQLVAELEKAAKTAKGSLQQVLRKMATLLGSSRPGGALDKQLFQDLQEAFSRFSQDSAALRTPPVLMESLEWVHTCFIARRLPSAASGAAVAKPAASGTGVGKGGKDSFESGTDQHARALSGDVPPPPGQPNGQQEQLESMKNWMMNPGLGKVKG